MSGKIHPKKPIGGTQFGTTIEDSDPAKFHGPGKTRGKTMSNGVVAEAKGATITCNETHIPTMNADKPAPASKQVKESSEKDYNPYGRKPSGSNEPTVTTPPYPLKKEYRK